MINEHEKYKYVNGQGSMYRTGIYIYSSPSPKIRGVLIFKVWKEEGHEKIDQKQGVS